MAVKRLLFEQPGKPRHGRLIGHVEIKRGRTEYSEQTKKTKVTPIALNSEGEDND